MSDLALVQSEATEAIASASTLEELDELRVRFTGKRSPLVEAQQQMRDLTPEERKTQGQAINAFKRSFEEAYEGRREGLAAEALRARLEGERIDLTLPATVVRPGRPHLLTQVFDEIVETFVGLGYRVADGPEAESGIFNFDMMNIAKDHPARQEMDTIYVSAEDDVVLRTHTSPVQARTMVAQEPPIAIVVPGRVYRADAVDATHSPVFHQVEGLMVAEGITMADLRGTLLAFAQAMFGDDREIRLRPSMFPFTEPSAEVDVSCGFCDRDGSACRVCSGTGWIEILGCGMVDPAVLTACEIDPERYSGFAFGVGVERVAMLRHGVRDIRDFYEGDVRFLARF